jgi:ribosomal small subunit protein bTHX
LGPFPAGVHKKRSISERKTEPGDLRMGKGDKRTKRGKLFKGTFGKRRMKAEKIDKKPKEESGSAS